MTKTSTLSPHPLVSIITPSYNQGAYIAETIHSVRSQTYAHIEHIVIDAVSTDGTLAILEEAALRGRIRFVSEPDQGMYSAINKGLGLATGDVLAYLNSDDLYLPWSVEAAVSRLTGDATLGFVYGDVINFDDGTHLGRLHAAPPFHHGRLVRRGFLYQPTVFWTREVAREYGVFDETLHFIADCDYWMRIGHRTRGVKIPEIMAFERNHPAAKRYASTQAMDLELEQVRRRHGAPGNRPEQTVDRFYYYVWRVWFTMLCALRRLRLLPRRRSAYQHGFGPARPSAWRLFMTLVPLVGQRVKWNIEV